MSADSRLRRPEFFGRPAEVAVHRRAFKGNQGASGWDGVSPSGHIISDIVTVPKRQCKSAHCRCKLRSAVGRSQWTLARRTQPTASYFQCALDEARALENAERFYVFQECAKESFGAEIYIKPRLAAPWIMKIVQTQAVLDAVESVIGPNTFLWSSDFFNKKAGSGKHVGFHQESPYWGLDPTDGVVSAWIALTPSLKSSGCMQVVKGTHAYGILDHRKTYDPNSLLSVGQEVVHDYGPEDITGAELQSGDMPLHHLNLTHGGQPKTGENDRIGLLLRLVNAKTRQTKAPDSSLLVRGEDTYGHFEHELAPETELGDNEIAQLRRVFAHSPSGFGGRMVA